MQDPQSQRGKAPAPQDSWRDIILSGADVLEIEGGALEMLIDLHRGFGSRDTKRA